MLLCGLIALAATACSGSGAPPNLSTASVPVSPPRSSVSAPPVSTSAPPVRTYPPGVPLTGHNVRPGEKPPIYPAAAKARTQAGANAFAEFFLKTFDWAYATTNSAYAKHYTAPSCGLCTGLETGIAKTAAAKHWYLGGRFTVHPATFTEIAPVTAPADFCSIVAIDESAEEVVDKTGKVFNGDGAHKGDRVKLCAQFSGMWKTTYLAFQK